MRTLSTCPGPVHVHKENRKIIYSVLVYEGTVFQVCTWRVPHYFFVMCVCMTRTYLLLGGVLHLLVSWTHPTLIYHTVPLIGWTVLHTHVSSVHSSLSCEHMIYMYHVMWSVFLGTFWFSGAKYSEAVLRRYFPRTHRIVICMKWWISW